MSDMSEEEYDFEYSDEEEEEQNVDIENQYYNAKANKDDDIEAALSDFRQVLEMEEEKGEWGFKALKQIVKLRFKLGNYEDMMESFRILLSYTRTAVTRNVGEKGINSILDFVSNAENNDVLQDVYETTLEALKEAKNERLWFKTNAKLGNLLFEKGEYHRLKKILKELQASCQSQSGDDDVKKGTQLLEVLALQIQMYTAQKDNKKLKNLYQRALRIKSAIPHPKIMGVIRECGGKMHMMEREWEKARTDFFEGFKSYDEAGEPRRLQCLKYLVLANMLMQSKINPFDSQEAKPYEHDPEIVAMTNLTDAYMHDEIHKFESILRNNRRSIMEDRFIRIFIDDLLRTIRTQVLVKIIAPYTRISLQYITEELNGVAIEEVETLLVSLILDKKIDAHINQLEGILVMGDRSNSSKKYNALDKWTDRIATLEELVMNKIPAQY